MASLQSNCIKASSPDDYCIDLRLSPNFLLSCFNSSNTIQSFSIPSLQLAGIYPTGSSGVLSEISVYDENSVIWCDRQGRIGIIDLRTSHNMHNFAIPEEIFTIDSCGNNIVAGSNKKITVWDIRNFKVKKTYEDLYMDDNDITSVRLSSISPNLLLSCSEDSLMSICNIDSINEDDYTLINVEEPALKVGFCDNNIYCVTINKLVSYDPHFFDSDVPLELLSKHRLSEYQSFNPEIAYFVSAHQSDEVVVLAGSHE